MTTITLEKLCEVLNTHFGEPYLAAGGVTAELVDNEGQQELSITIGRRDVTIGANGELVGSGTFVMMPDNILVAEEEQ
jgi:hypothetical protein